MFGRNFFQNFIKKMPKGIKGFQKGHIDFVPTESRKRVGRIVSRKIREKFKGKRPPWLKSYPEISRKNSPFVKGHQYTVGEKHPSWKGDKVGKSGLHEWMRRRLGKPNYCEHCKITESRRYEWANKSRKYKRDLTDWIRLCVPCHRKYDQTLKNGWITRRKKYKFFTKEEKRIRKNEANRKYRLKIKSLT